MRLVRFESAEGARTGAVLDGDRVLDLGTATVVELLADRALLTAARAVGASTLPLDSLRLLPPVMPGKILCIGYNYRGHVPAGGEDRPVPTTPDVFVKTPNTLGAPGDPVTLPLTATDVDYEGEIALVIGRGGRDIPLEEAAAHIAGYTLVNDVSERTWQGRSSQWTLGKCSDGFAPLGPWLVTPDEIADTGDLRVEVVRDVIATGSPQKLPEALAAHRPLADGDAVTIRVDGIGSLTTTFRKARP
ncbi:fumarylacetoacetate hydrolase family protein [Rathayibacter sp. VKM Ac-2858]|uniref:fumarylacetoacetate hydrolase family protein n=1 Tax=unclassified Rathayibacter TaxID=2609250 RepID=UPI00349F6277